MFCLLICQILTSKTHLIWNKLKTGDFLTEELFRDWIELARENWTGVSLKLIFEPEFSQLVVATGEVEHEGCDGMS